MDLKFLVVDDERLALNDLAEVLKRARPGCEVHAFCKPSQALTEIRKNGFRPGTAFLDIEMRGRTGFELAAELKRTLPSLKIVFVTAFSQYALKAYSVHACGYLMKPVTVEAVREELDCIGSLTLNAEAGKSLRVQCFGTFEVFHNAKPLEFSRSKCKELFAYLVDRRGASCSVKEIAAVLFEDREYGRSVKNQVEIFKSDLIKTLRAAGCEHVLVNGRNRLAINVPQIDCDYYRFLSGDIAAVNSYAGEYMAQYSWAEMTCATLSEKIK